MVDKQALINAIRKGGANLVDFRRIILVNGENQVRPAPFHYTWSDALLHGEGNIGIEGFRESAKDQIVNRSFPEYAIMYPSKSLSYIVIIRNNDTQAVRSLKAIFDESISNPLIRQRVKKIIKNNGNELKMLLTCDDGNEMIFTVEAYGKGASIRGLALADRRPDIIILNDIQDQEDSRSEAVLEKDWDWFLSDVKFLGQYTRIFMIGNNLGEKCVIERVFANPVEAGGFTTFRVPICNDEMTVSNWPEKYTIESIIAERASYTRLGKLDIWLRERMCKAVSDETRIFRDKDLTFFPPSLTISMAAEAEEVFATLDPASSKELGACFRAIIICARMKDGHWYIVDVPYGRWDSVELLDKMFSAVRRWGIRRFGIEKGMFKQVFEPFIYKEMTKRNVRFSIEEIEHAKAGSKLERIKMLQPRFRAHAVWFPNEAEWLDEIKAELAGVTRTEIKSQFIDLVDALAMCEQMDVSLDYGVVKADKNTPKWVGSMKSSSGGSSMAA